MWPSNVKKQQTNPKQKQQQHLFTSYKRTHTRILMHTHTYIF